MNSSIFYRVTSTAREDLEKARALLAPALRMLAHIRAEFQQKKEAVSELGIIVFGGLQYT